IILIINAGYFIALILTILGIIGLISENFKTQSSKIIIFTVFGILILFVVINFDAVFGYLEDISEGTMYHSKIQDIISSVSEDDTAAVGTVYARYERYTRSIKLFLESPIWGQLTRADIGKHSQILDYFAQYGVFVGIWFCSIFTGFRKNLVRNYPDKNGFITVVF
ncbi:MAG: hypothetical protein LIO93_12920, partial [Bacteroidales bacterium]|nr:hypothetical protein [Bacteroidales bacterium]